MRHSLTYTITATLATLAGVQALTVEYQSDRLTPDHKDGNARHALARSLCATLAKGADGRTILASAHKGDAKAILALTLASAEAYKDASKAMEAIKGALADPSKGWPVAIPRMSQHAGRALESWQDAEDARKAKDAKASAKAESAKPATVQAPTRPAPVAKGFPTLATIQAHQSQAGTSVARKVAPAWQGRKVA